jgi:hypothetical protein
MDDVCPTKKLIFNKLKDKGEEVAARCSEIWELLTASRRQWSRT